MDRDGRVRSWFGPPVRSAAADLPARRTFRGHAPTTSVKPAGHRRDAGRGLTRFLSQLTIPLRDVFGERGVPVCLT